MALTVEELQIVLSCDATTAQAVLEKMDATVKAYTQKFQSYFDNTNKGKTTKVSGLDAVAKNVENQTKKLAKAGSDWKKQYEQTFGETFESSMMKAKIRSSAEHGTGEYIPSGKKYVGGDENGRGGGMGDPNLYSKSIVEYRRQIEGVAQAAKEASTSTGRMLAPTFGETFKATLASLPDLINSFVMRSTDALSKVGSVIGKTFSVGAKVAIGAIRMIGTVAGAVAKGIGTAFKVAGGLIRGIAGAAQKVGSSIKKAFNNTLLGKFVKRLGTVMMRMAAMKLIRGTIDGFKKGLEELAKTSSSSAKAMNSIKAAGGSIKMALGAVLMPIVKALVPVFVQIAGVVNTAANAIARFFAVLTGQGQYTAVNFSGALDDVSESAGGAGKAVKSMLADFDELNVLQKNSGGGGGSFGVESSLSTVADDQTAFSELGEIIRNSILHGDWSGAATAITDKLNALIRDIPWGDIGTRIGTYLDGALEFLATAITTFDWNGLGASLAEACNASIVRVDWANLGTVLSGKFSIVIRSLGSFLENLNFSELADGFSKFAIGFFDGITNAIESVDWKKIGENVKTFLKNVNWSGIADSIMEGIGAALGGLAALIWGLVEEAWDNVVKWWKDVAYEDGQFTISGLLDGIVKALSSIGTWIKEHIFNPIINGFKKAFGIASPAKKMNEPGQMVGEGILEGFANAFKSIGTWLDEKIFTPLVNGIEEGAKAVWAWLETAVSNVGLFFDKVKAALGIGVEYVVAFFKTIVDTITAKADVIKLSAEKIVANVKTAVLQKLKDLVDALNDGPVGKLLKAIGVDLTNASASLGKKIDESKQKSQQLDSAIQDAQATAAKGFDIEANVNKEKVDKYKETLKKPWAQTVKVGTEGTKTATDNINAVAKAAKGVNKTFKPTVSTLGTVHARENLTMVKQAGDGVAKTFVTKSKTEGTVNSKNNITNVKTAAASINKTFTSKVRTDGTVNAKDNITKVKKAADGVNKTFTPKFQTAGTVDSKNNVAALKKVVDGTAKTFTTKFQTAGTVDSKNSISAVKKAADAAGKTFTTKIVTDGISTSKDNISKVKTAADGVAKTFTARISTSGVDTATKAVKGFSDDLSGLDDVSVKVTATLNEQDLHDSLGRALSGVSVDIKATTKDNQTINAGTVSTKLSRNVPREASGGLAYGMTSAIIGEYAGARSNPEVIAPLNKLQGILERSNTGGNKDTMTREQANTMIGLLKELTKKETVVRPSVELGQVVDRSLKAYART